MKYTNDEILAACNKMCQNTLMETLGIEFTEVGDNFLVARMPVTTRVHQPDGVLHGGASVALAESVGSAAAFMFLNAKDVVIRGIEIAANHVKSVSDGYVYAHASIVHKGRTTQLWQIKIKNENGALVSLVKLTTLTLPKKP
ncbi:MULTISPECIES: PaaI family thioesterase [Aequorivita]|uniref:Hotdog fold thioesterase n=1 Tax=Aequorivita iocasae TaxID=2803865 RepID=A0ABX7DRX6_9FLAO|nr:MULTISPECIES: hotdog fold thioesterase [Aequorivita]PHR13064.1 MAG: thioesterase [Aequorivita sp.]QQX75909.1 hotdog fold thioesterase [Aequorivita iocasae]UCA55371.1 hotdog fold thioesterase [Aequorivita sp. F7]